MGTTTFLFPREPIAVKQGLGELPGAGRGKRADLRKGRFRRYGEEN